MKGYDTAEYARTRLLETIIRFEGRPVMVANCEDHGNTIMIHFNEIMGDHPPDAKPIEMFDLDPVPLGYVNFSARATYITRMPMRKDWRQGMRMSNIADVSGFSPTRMPFRVLGKTIMGDFPTFHRAIEGVSRKSKPAESMAFSRDFAVTNEGILQYKGILNVGEVNLSEASVIFPEKNNWVREAFNEVMENAA